MILSITSKESIRSRSFFVHIEQIVDILGYAIVDCFVAGPVHLAVLYDDFCDRNCHFRREVRRNIHVFFGAENRGGDAVEGLCVHIIPDGCRIADRAATRVIVLHDRPHFGKVFRLGMTRSRYSQSAC